MTFADEFPFKVPAPQATASRQRFSLTSDILSYRRCEKQYGAFGRDGFVPARANQQFFGHIIHQVLDLCHRHFAQTGALPSTTEIDQYFIEVQSALRSHGIRAVSSAMADTAREVLYRFNALEGPTLYPRVRDTEFRLEADRESYVLRGVVDVLAVDPNDPDNPAEMEIWDYKGSKRPAQTDPRLRDYEWQMMVYAELYRQRYGVHPKRAVLYFMNELMVEPPPTSRPLRAIHVVNFDAAKITKALAEFDKTAGQIMTCQATNQWPNPANPPDKGTCDICDLRWNCSIPTPAYPMRTLFAK